MKRNAPFYIEKNIMSSMFQWTLKTFIFEGVGKFKIAKTGPTLFKFYKYALENLIIV